MGLNRLLFLIVRDDHRCNLADADPNSNSHPNSNSNAQSNSFANAQPDPNSKPYTHTFANTCAMGARTGEVFALDG